MPRVVPSQVVEVIDQLFPDTRVSMGVTARNVPQLAAIAAFAKEIPPELLTLAGHDLSNYIVSIQYIEITQALALRDPTYGYEVPKYLGRSTIEVLREALSKCPDQVPATGTTELQFIADPDLRDSIRRDISAANQDIVNAEWKGATVLAGSATEALLLWAIQQATPTVIAGARSALIASNTLSSKSDKNPEHWGFRALIETAVHLGRIKSDAATQALLGKDFRNLIHPGRAARLGQVCDRATALSALAAVEHVVRDLRYEVPAVTTGPRSEPASGW